MLTLRKKSKKLFALKKAFFEKIKCKSKISNIKLVLMSKKHKIKRSKNFNEKKKKKKKIGQIF